MNEWINEWKKQASQVDVEVGPMPLIQLHELFKILFILSI